MGADTIQTNFIHVSRKIKSNFICTLHLSSSSSFYSPSSSLREGEKEGEREGGRDRGYDG
jgi:hypothetical protein